MAAGGALGRAGEGGQGMEGECVRLPTQRKESNVCPVSNAMLGSSGTELLVRRKLTFSCVYELNLWLTLGLISPPCPPSCYRVQYSVSKEITFSSFSPSLFFFFSSNAAQDELGFFPSAFQALSLACHAGSGCCCPCLWGTRDIPLLQLPWVNKFSWSWENMLLFY